MKKLWQKNLETVIGVLFGNVLLAFTVAAFMLPHGIIMGGATGLGPKRTMSDAAAKSPNRCHNFALNPIDAFGENEKGYQLRKQKKTQCDGQLSLFQGTENRIKHMNFSGGEGV